MLFSHHQQRREGTPNAKTQGGMYNFVRVFLLIHELTNKLNLLSFCQCTIKSSPEARQRVSFSETM